MITNNIPSLKYLTLELLQTERLLALNGKQVTTGQIFESTNVFHREGLFSTEIFGDVGSSDRFRNNGYIDLKLKILHPLVYLGIVTMSSLHSGILDGTKKAIFDKEKKDFILDESGETGYDFYMKHFKDVELVFADYLKDSKFEVLKTDMKVDVFFVVLKDKKKELRKRERERI